MHRYRITFLAGLAAGFVLGTRAGRQRYEQMKKLARSAADNPAVQQAAGALQAQATGMLKSASAKLADELHQRVPKLAEGAKHKVGERAGGLRHRNGSSAGANGSAGASGSHPFASASRADRSG